MHTVSVLVLDYSDTLGGTVLKFFIRFLSPIHTGSVLVLDYNDYRPAAIQQLCLSTARLAVKLF